MTRFRSYGWRKSVPVAEPGWIYQSRWFGSYDEAHSRAVTALTERYGQSMFEYLTHTGDVSITVESKERDPVA